MALTDDIKLALRIKTTAYDAEVNDLIGAAQADLKTSGILDTKTTSDDTLIKRAVTLYAKSHFGLDNEDSGKYQIAYDSLRNHLCLSTEYTEVADV